jgi:hypothetical protein
MSDSDDVLEQDEPSAKAICDWVSAFYSAGTLEKCSVSAKLLLRHNCKNNGTRQELVVAEYCQGEASVQLASRVSVVRVANCGLKGTAADDRGFDKILLVTTKI